MKVFQDGKTTGTIGGGALEKFCTEKALELFLTKQNLVMDFNLDKDASDCISMICGGKATVEFKFIDKLDENLREDVSQKNRVIIFGGGHVGTELCPILSNLDFEVVVYDDREEYASSKRHGKAAKCIHAPFNRIKDNIEISEQDYVVVMTHGHIADREVLLQICKVNPKYIGCMGSAKKAEDTVLFLRKNGISEEIIRKIYTPIGLPIYSETPAEIAISIAAQLIIVKNRV